MSSNREEAEMVGESIGNRDVTETPDATQYGPYGNYERWKLPTPSFIAVRKRSPSTERELYSGSFR